MSAWYRTGTVEATNASATVTGTTTAWTNNVKVGDVFVPEPDGRGYEVTAINSNTEIEISPVYAGSTGSGKSYGIARVSTTWNSVSELAVDVAELVSLSQNIFGGEGVPSDELGTDGDRYFRSDEPEYYVKSSGSWGAAIGLTGPTGATGATGATGSIGPAGTIAIGTVTTGTAGTSAAVANSGSSTAAVLDFTIPRGNTGATGATGPQGAAATIAVGTVTTLSPGASATVSNAGTTGAAVFDFGIPQGATGSTGATGASFTWEGIYDSGTEYSSGNVVRDQDATWVYINASASTGNDPPTLPTTSNSYWELMTQDGVDGSGAVNSINAQTGAVVLSGADIETGATTNSVTPAGTSIDDYLTAVDAAFAAGVSFAETTVASASTTDIGAAATQNVVISGTTTITSLGTVADSVRFVRFAAALTLTHNATSLILPGAANITTVAGDTAIFSSNASGNWRCRHYQRVSSFGAAGSNSVNDFRLTLTSATPVLTADVTAATTLYLTPYTGNQISLYSGSTWAALASAEVSLSLSGYTADSNYDIFAYNNSGTLTLESVIWTNSTTRATALTTQDGVYVKSGDATRRYIGTIRTTGTTGQTQIKFGSSAAGGGEAWIGLWNVSNRVNATMLVHNSTSLWTYNSTTWRGANGSSTFRISMIVGIAAPVTALYQISMSGGASGDAMIGINVDSTSATPGGIVPYFSIGTFAGAAPAILPTILSVGFHYLQAMERQASTASSAEFFSNNLQARSGLTADWSY